MAAIGLAAVAAVGVAASVIFWDADFYAARTRWENFKIAMFGPWQPGVTDGSASACPDTNAFEEAFKGIVDFNFFRSVPVEGTSLSVKTGTAFTSSRDVLSGKTSRSWCYVIISPERGLPRQVALANQSAGEKPVYTDFSTHSTEELKSIGLNARQLLAIAKSHCRFDSKQVPAQTDQGGLR